MEFWGVSLETWVLIFTMLVIIYYTIETSKLRKSTKKQTDLLLQPLITLEHEIISIEEDTEANYLVNIGKSTAINIQIDDKYIEEGKRLIFYHDDTLQVDKRKQFFYRIYNRDGRLENSVNIPDGIQLINKFNKDIVGPVDGDGRDIHISFQDIQRNNYYTIINVNEDTIKIKSIKKEKQLMFGLIKYYS